MSHTSLRRSNLRINEVDKMNKSVIIDQTRPDQTRPDQTIILHFTLKVSTKLITPIYR